MPFTHSDAVDFAVQGRLKEMQSAAYKKKEC